ncbi:MAG: glycosyltransferase family 2 protein [Verrucomicrobiota bacterium]|nr:glycosyltransferase family 2 protein [Verrucomicrobiota bacterium]
MITVCILAKNSAQTLERTLDSVRSFSEVILLDNGSTDETLSIARRYANVKVVQHSFIGFGSLRNKAAQLASHDWILALDTDEVCSPALLTELSALTLDPQIVYSIPRHNFYNGKHIKGCGWFPDRVFRLYHRKMTHYSPVEVHEAVITDGLSTRPLHSPILHTPFRSTAEFLSKMQLYSTLFAQQHARKRSSSLLKAFFRSLYTFFRCYFFQRGFLLGREGFIVSLYNSNSTFYKYLKLWEKNH